ncbi:MAG TPA: ribonuclease HI family protein [Ignavibacteria bacterium]|nr:ribonuclease HI family protein [Ignavibacteria bacterium]
MSKIILNVYTDGASRGNPGLAGIGIVIKDIDDNIVTTGKKFLGLLTNNSSEYTALIESVKLLRTLDLEFSEVNFFLDSELVVKQIKGQYKIKHKDLIKLSIEFWSEIKLLGKNFTITHIPREKNKIADKLANEAIDERDRSVSD